MDGRKNIRGLIDSTSSRFLRANRSRLVPDLDKVKIHERLEELLVFEILKDGGTLYHRFSVRTLYKHVIKAMTAASDIGEQNKSPKRGSTAENNKQPGLLDQPAFGNAVANAGEVRRELVANTPPKIAKPNHKRAQSFGLTAIKEGDINILNQHPQDSPEVTYRERLGGYLHPRDMRKLVTPFSASNEPEFIVRRHAMLLNFDPLRAIILRDRLLVLVPDGADSLLVELERRVRGTEKGLSEGMKHSMSMDFDNLSATSNGSASKKKNGSSTAIASAIPSTIKELSSGEQQGDNTGMDIDHPQDNYMKTGMVADNVISILKSKRLDKNGASEASTENLSVDVFNPMVDDEWEEMEARGWIDLPFELQSVDAVLHSVGAILTDEVFDLQSGANGIIEELLAPGADFGDHAQEMLRGMKNSVGEMTSRVKGFCRAIDMILEDYEDMTLMNLSRLLTHPERFIQPVPQAVLEEESDEPELILEAHLQRGNTLTNALTLVQGQISTTEDFAVRKSDTIRNRLLYINMMISILSLAVTAGSFVGSIFGMNVPVPYADDPNAFRVIVGTTVGGAVVLVVFLFVVLRKLAAM